MLVRYNKSKEWFFATPDHKYEIFLQSILKNISTKAILSQRRKVVFAAWVTIPKVFNGGSLGPSFQQIDFQPFHQESQKRQ